MRSPVKLSSCKLFCHEGPLWVSRSGVELPRQCPVWGRACGQSRQKFATLQCPVSARFSHSRRQIAQKQKNALLQLSLSHTAKNRGELHLSWQILESRKIDKLAEISPPKPPGLVKSRRLTRQKLRFKPDKFRFLPDDTIGKFMAGVVGFEPTIHGTKNRCLTTWLHPNDERLSTTVAFRVQALFWANVASVCNFFLWWCVPGLTITCRCIQTVHGRLLPRNSKGVSSGFRPCLTP